MSEMKKAITDGVFPPAGGPNGDVTAFFCATDKILQGLMADLEAAPNADAQAHCMTEISKRMVTLLSGLFPGHDFHMQYPNPKSTQEANNIVYDGQVFECFSEGNYGPLGTNNFAWFGAE